MTDLKAGRELDALVAEKVFGHRPTWKTVRAVSGDRRELETFVERYSTDIAAAWLVVEKLLAGALYPDVISTYGPNGVQWRCEVDSYSDPDATVDPWPVEVAADTAPLAICLAALEAIEASKRHSFSVRAEHSKESNG